MFSVSCIGSSNGRVSSIERGTCFGWKDAPITFQVITESIPVPLTIRFFIREDATKPPATFVVGEIESGNVVDVAFFNIPNNGNSGLKAPADIITVNNMTMSFMFRIESAFKADSYVLTYEFFEQPVSIAQ